MTRTKTNDINALHLDSMGIDTPKAHSLITIQEMSVIRFSFSSENFHISIIGYRKHFQYVAIHLNSITKLKRISETNNTLWGHCFRWDRRIKNQPKGKRVGDGKKIRPFDFFFRTVGDS